jgi:hypothetical protein
MIGFRALLQSGEYLVIIEGAHLIGDSSQSKRYTSDFFESMDAVTRFIHEFFQQHDFNSQVTITIYYGDDDDDNDDVTPINVDFDDDDDDDEWVSDSDDDD